MLQGFEGYLSWFKSSWALKGEGRAVSVMQQGGLRLFIWFIFLRQMDILASMKYQDIEDILVLFSIFSPRSIRWGRVLGVIIEGGL